MSTTDVHPALASRYRWMNWTEAAAYLGLTERQLRRAVEGRKVPFTRLGRELRFRQEDLDAYVEANTYRPEGVTR